MTLEDVERLIRNTRDPKVLFGDDVEATLKRLRVACHPDRHLDRKDRAEAAFKALGELAGRAKAPPVVVQSPRRSYQLVAMLGIGDVADVHLARADDRDYVVKIARVPQGAALLEAEHQAVAAILTRAGDEHYRKYFPTLAESFPVRDRFPKRVNVFTHEPGGYTVEQVLARHPAGLDGRHLAWVFKRLFVALGFAHECGIVHGAPVPCHALVYPENHGLQLVGWGHAVMPGEAMRTVPARYLSWYPPEVRKRQGATPATDIFLAAKTLVFLAGGDPATDQVPDAVPQPMGRFLRSCLLEGRGMRPQDAWTLHDEFDEMLRGLYGPPKFHVLSMA